MSLSESSDDGGMIISESDEIMAFWRQWDEGVLGEVLDMN